MNVIVFGATGMVGHGALLECLAEPGVERVLVVGRTSCGVSHAKMRELLMPDLANIARLRTELAGYDACFYSLGVSALGMTEDAYRRVTYDLTMAAAVPLAELNPAMTFCYVSGSGTDSSERGRVMWARVKGATENALFKLPFRAYAFRPGYIQPMKGVRSRTGWYQRLYDVAAPLYPVLRRLVPALITTTENVGRAMIRVAQHGYDKRILDPVDINAVAALLPASREHA